MSGAVTPVRSTSCSWTHLLLFVGGVTGRRCDRRGAAQLTIPLASPIRDGRRAFPVWCGCGDRRPVRGHGSQAIVQVTSAGEYHRDLRYERPVGGDRFPSLHRERFICPHCAAFAGQYWAALGVSGENNDHEWLEASWDGDPFDERRTSRSTWNAAQCASCHQWSIWRESQMVHPQRQVGAPAHPDMPEGPRILYGEAAAVAAVSRRAGAAMARAALETLIKEIDAEAPRKARLEDRIGRLRGRVSTRWGSFSTSFA